MNGSLFLNPSSSTAPLFCSSSSPMATAVDVLTPINATVKDTNSNALPTSAADESSRCVIRNGISISSRNRNGTRVCRYFLHGRCRFGANCRFLHVAAGGEVISCSGNDGNDDNTYKATSSNSSFQNLTPTANAISTATSTATSASTSASASLSVSRSNSFSNASVEGKLSSELTNWAKAPPFVPRAFTRAATAAASAAGQRSRFYGGPRSWADVVRGTSNIMNLRRHLKPGSVAALCPYDGPCPYGAICAYALHMEPCKMCDQYCLHPMDVEQRRVHIQRCLKRHEKAMELSFAIAASRDKMCGICMENIVDKTRKERRFGIMQNCKHIFCLACIRTWRQATDFPNKVIRSCPECRIGSDFVCPSPFWVETKEQKDKLLDNYRTAMGQKDCKYFKKGTGICPFGNKCFYKHAIANGNTVDASCSRPKSETEQRDSGNSTIDCFNTDLLEYLQRRDSLDSNLCTCEHSDLDTESTDTE